MVCDLDRTPKHEASPKQWEITGGRLQPVESCLQLNVKRSMRHVKSLREVLKPADETKSQGDSALSPHRAGQIMDCHFFDSVSAMSSSRHYKQ